MASHLVGVRLKYTRMWPFPPEKKKNVLLVGKPGRIAQIVACYAGYNLSYSTGFSHKKNADFSAFFELAKEAVRNFLIEGHMF